MKKRYLHIAAALGLAAALGACGGRSNDDGPGAGSTSSSGVPASAQQSATGLVTYLTQLIAQTSETSEPVMLGDAVLPTSETESPVALN